MVEELRKIILSHDEVLLALESFRRVAPTFLPSGKIVQWRSGPDSTMIIELGSADAPDAKGEEISLKTSDLFEPTVKYCIANNIMLPRNSRKCVRIEKDRVALYVIIGSPEEAVLCPQN